MTYWSLNAVFLAVVAVVVVAAILARRAPRWRAVGLAAIVVLVFTVIFDNILVGTGIVGYDPARISGARIGVAPLEDFAYAIAALALLPTLWELLSPRHPSRALPSSATAAPSSGAVTDVGSARGVGDEGGDA